MTGVQTCALPISVKPREHLGVFVGSVVVADEIERLIFWGFSFDEFQAGVGCARRTRIRTRGLSTLSIRTFTRARCAPYVY